jgi:hypothetical protein
VSAIRDSAVVEAFHRDLGRLCPKRSAGRVEEGRDLGLSVGQGEVELGGHRIEEDAPPEETEGEGTRALAVGVEGRPVVDDLTIGEDDGGEWTVALDLGRHALFPQDAPQSFTEPVAEREETGVGVRGA